MKIFTILSVFVLVLGSVQAAQAGSRHGHQGYTQGHKPSYKNGANGWLKQNRGHKPRHHGHRGHKPKRYGHKHHNYRHDNRGSGHGDGYFWGGLFFGALLGHALTTSQYSSGTSYTTHSTTSYEPLGMPPATSFEHERLILGVDGSCTLVSSDADGNEIRQPLAPSECRY